MFSKVIYEKVFPVDPILKELSKQKEADEFNNYQAQFPSFQAMMLHRELNTTYIRLPYKIRNRQKFIDAAIELSEFYELDLVITQFKGLISATFYFDACAGMRKLNKLMAMADEFDFMTNIREHDICMTLNYYTHKIVRQGIVWAP